MKPPLLHLLSFTFAAALSAQAATLTVNPIGDAFVTSGSADSNSGSPTSNYGGSGALDVAAPGSPEGEMQTLMMFDLASVKASFDTSFGVGKWSVSSVTLQLGTDVGNEGDQPPSALFSPINGGLFKIDWMANDSWLEGTGRNTNPTTDGVTFASLGGLLGSSDRTLGTLTYNPVGNTNAPSIPPAIYSLALDGSFVADMMAGNHVSLRAYAGDTSVSYVFNSRSYIIAGNRPVLAVTATATPEPATAALAAAAAVVCFGRRRRRIGS